MSDELIGELTFRRSRLTRSSGETPNKKFSNSQECAPALANVVCSDIDNDSGEHFLVLDCDYDVQVIESSTQGHHHVIFGEPISYDDMLQVLNVMAEVGLIQPGYAKSAEVMGFSTIRKPGILKSKDEDNYGLDDNGKIESQVAYEHALKSIRES